MTGLPRKFGVYELEGEVARGASGLVYRARHPIDGSHVALKLLREEAPGYQALERFRREARMAARLKHPHIVPVLDAGEVDGRFFFTMPLLTGRPLSDFFLQDDPTPAMIARMMETIARAVHYAHGEGVIHRDLKPSNILVTEDGEPVVTDFGIARDRRRATVLTTCGELLGTPSYMAPEQVTGRADLADPRTDVYALGSILYLALAQRVPFDATNFVELSARIIHQVPEPPSGFNAAADPGLERICLKCLSKDPDDRYPTAQALAEDLASFNRSVEPPPRKRRLPGFIALVVIAAVVGSGCMFLGGPARPHAAAPGGMTDGGGFWIDRAEVTQAEYAKFVAETGHRAPSSWRNRKPPRGQEERPVTQVSWEDAAVFAAWAKKRLPTADEWKAAASGIERLETSSIVCAESALDDGSRDARSGADVSDAGALHMGGNVAEWTSTIGSAGDRMRVVCGGHWRAPARKRLAEEEMPVETRESTIGFRCAAD